MSDFRVTVRIDPKLTAYLDPETRRRKLRAAGAETLGYIETQVVEHTPVDRNLLRGSVFHDLRGFPIGPGKVATPSRYAVVVEEGRREKRKAPPVAVIADWLGRHGANPAYAFVVARAIGRRGIKGKHMFRNAAANSARPAERIFNRWLRF